jgi:hypothetical protein
MPRFDRLAIGLSVSLLALGVPLHGGDDLRMKVFPTVSKAPAFVQVEVRIERNEDNRALEVIADSGDYFRSSRLPLDGANAAQLHVVDFASLPNGRYTVRAVLLGSQHQRAATSATVLVVPFAKVH